MSIRIIKSESGKSVWVVGENTKLIKEQLKALDDLAFPAKWNKTKQAWNIVPKKGKVDSVMDQLRDLTSAQAQQAQQMPEISSNVAWVQPPKSAKSVKSKSTLKLPPKCKGITSKNTGCKNAAKYGDYCYCHAE